MKPQLTAKNWFGKVSAGLILGFLLALGASGLFRTLGGVDEAFFSTRGQFSMWMMAPVWALVVSLVFLFRTSLRAWGWLALANVVLWIPIFALGGVKL
ncbi:MAG: hypothetical protein IPG54_10800 [Sphingomonadales bacterium]|jgi:hypothetical protein|nr:hypothetical protein [Sphingomonadales bacterium]MBK9004192.1 hypothetical protein [Sphingomonadales bacterium]MBK9269369.1 hypothetical protein [Sphingomonadales bacterium]MBP6434395.1 hypothetical protein [Sphingorhabdus sp.]